MKKTCFLLVILLMAVVFFATGCVTEEVENIVVLNTEIVSFEGSLVEKGDCNSDEKKYLLTKGETFKFKLEIRTHEMHYEDNHQTWYTDKHTKDLEYSEVNFEYDQDLFEIYTDTQTGMIFIKALAICDESPLTVTTVYNGVEYLHQYLIWVRD